MPASETEQPVHVAFTRREAAAPGDAGVLPVRARAGLEKARGSQPPGAPTVPADTLSTETAAVQTATTDEAAPLPVVTATVVPAASPQTAPAAAWTNPAVLAALQGQVQSLPDRTKPAQAVAARATSSDPLATTGGVTGADILDASPAGLAAAPGPALDADLPIDLASGQAQATFDEPALTPSSRDGETASLLNTAGGPGAEDAAAPAATTQTVSHLASQIFDRLGGGAKATRFQVDLNPAGLGRVEVTVEISVSGELTAALSFENPVAAQELRARAGELQTALQQAGFDLTKTALHFDSGNHFGQGLWEQNQQGEKRPAFTPRAFADLSDTPETQSASPPRHSRAGGVDVTI